MNIRSTINTLFRVNPFKTLYFNLKCFDLNVALKLPVLINWGVKFHAISGHINIEGPILQDTVLFQSPPP